MSIKSAPTTSYYIDQFTRLRCAPTLLNEKLFPNAKEITESMSAFTAIRKALGTHRLGDSSIMVLDIACGHTPRTGALIAHLTNWSVHAVDPNLNDKRSYGTKNIYLHKDKIQNLHFYGDTVVICAVHPHVKTEELIGCVTAKELVLISIECCVPQKLDVPPKEEYDDKHIWSPCRKVRVWHWKEGKIWT